MGPAWLPAGSSFVAITQGGFLLPGVSYVVGLSPSAQVLVMPDFVLLRVRTKLHGPAV